MKMRSYQRDAFHAVREQWKEVNSTLVVLPTGTGKTICFAHLIKQAFPKKVLVIAHRTELIQQAVEKISRVTGFRCDIEMGEQKADVNCLFGGCQVVVSTIQTQCSGGDGSGRMGKFDPQMFGLLVIDECHHAEAKTYRRIIDYYRTNERLKIVGVTATPDRADEKALGQIFESVAFDYEILDAINDGWLVPVQQQMVTIGALDFSQIRTTAGDLNGKDLARVMEMESNLHGVASATIDIIKDRRTLVFTASVAHAEMMAEIFNRHRDGCADWVCGKTDKDLRKEKLMKFQTGQIQIMVNCGVLTEGYDNPDVEVIVMARPTKSRALYAQMAGRSLRPLEEIATLLNDVDSNDSRKQMIQQSRKPSALIIDFVGNSGRHKLMTTADILGGKIDDEVCEAAMKTAKERGVPVDMIALLDEEQKKHDAEVARRAKLKARAQYATQFVDPFGVLGLTPEKERGWHRDKQLSEKQKALLVKQGMDPDVLGYTKSKQLLNELFRRWDNKLASFKQIKLLKRYGYDDVNVTRDAASKIIDEIATKQGWAKRATDDS